MSVTATSLARGNIGDTIGVNLRKYPIVGVNQRSMRVWHAAGLKPRFNGFGFTKSGFQTPPTRKSDTKLTLMEVI